MIKRNKGNFHNDNQPIAYKLEDELDHIVKSVNQYSLEKDKEIKAIQATLNKPLVGGGGSASANIVAFNEKLIYGGENIIIIKDITALDDGLVLADLQMGDMLESITIITQTIDTHVNIFKINDGTSDIVSLNDIDLSVISVSTPPKAMWLEYLSGASLILSIAALVTPTFTGKVIIKIIRKPMTWTLA